MFQVLFNKQWRVGEGRRGAGWGRPWAFPDTHSLLAPVLSGFQFKGESPAVAAAAACGLGCWFAARGWLAVCDWESRRRWRCLAACQRLLRSFTVTLLPPGLLPYRRHFKALGGWGFFVFPSFFIFIPLCGASPSVGHFLCSFGLFKMLLGQQRALRSSLRENLLPWSPSLRRWV